MVYSNHFVMAVMVNGQARGELANGIVKMPFNTEYTLRFKNKNNRRAVVKIFVDGENVSGGGYVINAKDHIDIKRHHDKDRAFKFVSLDSPEAVEDGKNGPNEDKTKGTIEARFYLEKENPNPQVIHIHHDHWYRPVPRPRPWWNDDYPPLTNPYQPGQTKISWTTNATGQDDGFTMGTGGPISSYNMGSESSEGQTPSSTFSKGGVLRSHSSRGEPRSRRVQPGQTTYDPFGKSQFASSNESPLQDGCTVEGNSTGQSFRTVSIDVEDTYTAVKVFLQGHDSAVQTAPMRQTNKNHVISELEAENQELERKLEELRQQMEEKESEQKVKKLQEEKNRLLREKIAELEKQISDE